MRPEPIPAKHSASLHSRWRSMDLDLVMNAMNQIVARDAALNVAENPLAFTLSDYLREVSGEPGTHEGSVQQQLRLLDGYLKLRSDIFQAPVILRIINRPPRPHGCASRRSISFKTPRDEDAQLRFSMATKTAAGKAPALAASLDAALDQLPCSMSGVGVDERTSAKATPTEIPHGQWFQDNAGVHHSP